MCVKSRTIIIPSIYILKTFKKVQRKSIYKKKTLYIRINRKIFWESKNKRENEIICCFKKFVIHMWQCDMFNKKIMSKKTLYMSIIKIFRKMKHLNTLFIIKYNFFRNKLMKKSIYVKKNKVNLIWSNKNEHIHEN